MVLRTALNPHCRPVVFLGHFYENMAYRWWISWTSFASLLQCNSRRERRPLTTTPVSPRPSHLHGWRTDQGHESRFHPLLLSPCAPLPVSSLPCLSSDTVWLVLWLVTALQGPCQMFVLWESAGLALFSFSDSSLVGLRPFSLLSFHPARARRGFVALLVVFCGTGWASTSIDNLCPLFHLSSNLRFLTIQRVICLSQFSPF